MSMEKINSEELNGKQARIPLPDDELEQVTGGFTDNGNGTYNISYGETFYDGKMSFTPTETKLNVTETDHIQCDWFRLDSSGNMKDYGHSNVDVHNLLLCLQVL